MNTSKRPVSVALCHKNFAAHKHVSHIGLGVAALNTAKTLRRAGIEAHVWAICTVEELTQKIAAHPSITHVVISAPWIATAALQQLAHTYPNVEFTVNCHSNVGFLQADSSGVEILKQLVQAEHSSWNIHIAGNSQKFCAWVQSAFHAPCAYLPNLYFLDPIHHPHNHGYHGGVLKIGAFGATRPLKNLMSAAGAALEVSASLGVDVQFWISGGREDGGGPMLRAIRKLFEGETGARLHEASWAPWPDFKRKYVRPMHVMLQPSYTESFNMVTADAISVGVPVVVSPAIAWAPLHWQANPDDTHAIARVAMQLLQDRHAAKDGLRALEHHVHAGLRAWEFALSSGGFA